MGSGAVDSSQWLSVKEETIFLHDGLIRVTDLAELPSEIGVSEQGDTEQEVGENRLVHTQTQTHAHTHAEVYIQKHAHFAVIMVSFNVLECENVFSVFTATHPQ